MSVKKAVFLIFFAVIQITEYSVSQDRSPVLDGIELSSKVYSELSPQGARTIAMVDVNGEFSQGTVVTSDKIFDGLLAFFENEKVIAELELSSSQEDEFKKVVGEWRRDLDGRLEELSKAMKSDEKEKASAILARLPNVQTDGLDRIEDSLISYQTDRLAQIQLRYLIRTNGVLSVLENQMIRAAAEFEVQDISIVRNEMQKKKKELVKQVFKARDQSVEIFLKPLSEDERQIVFKKWRYLVDKRAPDLERIRVQLKYFEDFESLEKYDSVFTKISRFPEFEINVSGSFEPRINSRPVDRNNDGYTVASRIFKMTKSEEMAERMGLTDEQSATLSLIEKEFRSSVNKASTISITWSGGTPEELQAMKSQVRTMRQAAGRLALKQINEALLKVQMDRMEQVGEAALAKMYGPAFDLINGDLNEKLNLSKAKTEELKASRKKGLEFLEGESMKIEENWMDTLFATLSVEKREKVKKLFGEKLTNSPANLSVYLAGQ